MHYAHTSKKRVWEAPRIARLDVIEGTDGGNGIYVTEGQHILMTGYGGFPSDTAGFTGSGVVS